MVRDKDRKNKILNPDLRILGIQCARPRDLADFIPGQSEVTESGNIFKSKYH